MGLATSIPGFTITTNPSGGGSLPSWVPNAGQFANVSLNLPRDVDPCPAGNCVWSPNQGQEGIFNVWNGGAFCPNYSQYGALAMFGGGHAAYSGNEVLLYDITSRLFKRIGFPSPHNEEERDSNGEFPDGQPALSHQYDGITYVPPSPDSSSLGSVLKIDNPGDGRVTTRWVHRMPLTTGPSATGGWNRYANKGPSGFNGDYVAGAYDTTRNRVWLLGAGNSYYTGFGYLTPGATTGTVTLLANQGSNVDTNHSLEYCPTHDMLVQFAEIATVVGLCGRLCNSSTYFDRLTMTGSPPDEQNGMCWSTALNCFVTYEGDGGTRVYKLTPPATNPLTGAWNWTSQMLMGVGGAVPARANYPSDYNGLWGRFREVPALCDATRATFIHCDGRNNAAQLWCLPRT
jgi:hypothetical protein